MTNLAHWLHTPFAQSLGWTLVHFLWEGAVLAALLMAGLRLLRTAPARRRYALACVLLAAMPLAFGATLAIIWVHQPAAVVIRANASMFRTLVPLPPAPPRFSFASLLDRLAWLVPLWFAGVAFFYTRSVAGWCAIRRLRRRGVCAAPPEWQARLDRLAARLRLTRPVALLESCLTDAPVLIGYLRPVVLLPLGCLTWLSVDQVECILLHELAHVARHDYLVNVLQSAVEGLLFYHPAVWWASHVVRTERENCCDDRVVELMGDARSYAATLATLEHRRAPQAALAATGGSLMRRIRRLTTEPRTPAAPAASAGVLVVIFAAALAAVPARLPLVRHTRPAGVALAPHPAQDAQEDKLATPYQKWLKEDVVYIITADERAAFLRLTTDEEREQFIEQFWQRRGDGFKQEHYRRIAYANEHFGYQDVAGWKSDRGRVYITYGPPDEIDDHASGGSYQRPPEQGGGVTHTYPFQDWRYRSIEGVGNNVIVEFVDPGRTGEYRMTMDPHEKELRAAEKNAPFRVYFDYNRVPGAPAVEQSVAYVVADEERRGFVQARSTAQDSPRTKVFVSRDAPEVSVIVPPSRKSDSHAQADINGQLRNAQMALERQTVICAELSRTYQDGWPDVQVCREKVRQLEADIGGLQEQIVAAERPADAQVTVLVQLGDASADFHVLGEVTVPSGRKVANFEQDVHHEPALAHTVVLKPGIYHLTVTTKNTSTGVSAASSLDFTVE